jgi:hypothetical protein
VAVAEWKRELSNAVEISRRQANGCDDASANSAAVEIEEVDGPGIWTRVPMLSTAAEGCVLEPFAIAWGEASWLQGWADGRTLTLAVSSSEFVAALGLARAFLGVSGDSALTVEGAVPDGSELSG